MNDEVVFLTSKELAERWHVSESTLRNKRNEGKIPYFRPPGGKIVLYPLSLIVEVEHDNLTTAKKAKEKKVPITRRKRPEISSNSSKEWRI